MPVRPSQGNIGDGFGWRERHPITGKRAFHNGEDIGWTAGTAIVSPIDGLIKSYGYEGGWGYLLRIQNGSTIVRLAHLLRLSNVSVGDTVSEGQQVAVMGKSGNATGVHVHWEVEVDGITVDPSQWLSSFASTVEEKINEKVGSKMRPIRQISPGEHYFNGVALIGELTFELSNDADIQNEYGRVWNGKSGKIDGVTSTEFQNALNGVNKRRTLLGLPALDKNTGNLVAPIKK